MATGVPLELNRPLQAAEPCVLKVVCGYVCPSAERGEASSGRRGIEEVARASMHAGGGQPTRDGQSSGSAGSKSVVQKAPARRRQAQSKGMYSRQNSCFEKAHSRFLKCPSTGQAKEQHDGQAHTVGYRSYPSAW